MKSFSLTRALARTTALCLAAAALLAPLGAQELGEPLMLRLRDGSIRFGSLRGHDPSGVEFVRIDNGGVAQVPWSLLDPGQEAELRRAFGYVDDTAEEILVDADRLLLDDGREVIGKILDHGEDSILLKTSTATIPVPKSRVIAAATTVQVPASEIYTREELYAQALAQASDDAASQFALAQHCERILDFAHAVEHYEKARSLDAGFRPDDVRWALERAREKAARQDEIDYLAEVDLLLARKKFDEALQRAEAFAELYPDSPLTPDSARKVARVLKARQRALGELVVKRWYGAAAKAAREAALKEFDEVLAWLDEGMQEEVFQAVLEDARRVQADVEEDELRQLWIEREGGRWRLASYGHGTWLLGEDKALAGMEEEEEDEAAVAVTAKDKEREELEQRIKRFLENQELRRSAKSSQDRSDDRAAEWKLLSSTSRSQWILAYYAENSGDMEIRPRIAFRACTECGGRGVREIIVTGDARTRRGENQSGSGMHKVECPTCRGLGVIRRIYYR